MGFATRGSRSPAITGNTYRTFGLIFMAVLSLQERWGRTQTTNYDLHCSPCTNGRQPHPHGPRQRHKLESERNGLEAGTSTGRTLQKLRHPHLLLFGIEPDQGANT